MTRPRNSRRSAGSGHGTGRGERGRGRHADPDREQIGRRQRYAKKTNWVGIAVFFVVFAILGITVLILSRRMSRETGQNGDGDRRGVIENAKPAAGGRGGATIGRSAKTVSGRPAPEFKGDAVKHADRLFRAAKGLFARAEIAEEAGEKEESSSLMEDCRAKFVELHGFLRDYTSWLADAKAGGWEIPRVYATLVRRVATYAKFEARVPAR